MGINCYVSGIARLQASDASSESLQLSLTWMFSTNISLSLSRVLAFSRNAYSFIYLILTELMKVGVVYLSS